MSDLNEQRAEKAQEVEKLTKTVNRRARKWRNASDARSVCFDGVANVKEFESETSVTDVLNGLLDGGIIDLWEEANA